MNAAEKRGPLPTAIGEGLAGVARRRLWLLAVRGGAVATAVAAALATRQSTRAVTAAADHTATAHLHTLSKHYLGL